MRKHDVRIFLNLWQEAAGPWSKVRLAAYLAVGQLSSQRLTRLLPTVRLCFKGGDVEFRLSQGELLPYTQIQSDLTRGVIPRPADGEQWVVIDCGANIGLFSMLMKSAGRIIAVEPNPDVHARLVRNFHRNRLLGATVNKAVSSEPGNVRMNLHTSSVLATVEADGEFEIEATTIDAIALEQQIDQVDLLKLDVEGHEIEALRGATALLRDRRITRIYTEFNSPDALHELDEYLKPRGFKCARLSKFNALYVLAAPLPVATPRAAC